ncbi:MAG: CHAT domain-containing protein [Winogradskyella sp.]|uniref:CHAT domain-containing protein n=1 Tax=Winogradskyella sp. TaxID=1883156 RepID=UPI0025E5F028|nr:CHAT domain-containing protein [Winogradskyella sp.]NRB61097.1 CHAT domain-containing protein [Winogradskyella sp.]
MKNSEIENTYVITTEYDKDELMTDLDKLNYYFATQNSNAIINNRGSLPNKLKIKNKDFDALYNRISETLFPEVLNFKNLDHLIIVPSGNVGTAPFAALKIGDQYLIDKMSYSIAPSIGSILNINKERNGFNKALFITNPIFPNDDKWNFAELPGTAEEVHTITSLLNEDKYNILKEGEASKKNTEAIMENYDLLYFATHGYSDVNNPLDDSFIALSGNDVSNSFLTPREIQEKNLNARLVILSACQTGLGGKHDGGIIGLTRAFQIAGADHILMSLWNIDDAETATLMSMFFKEYINNKSNLSPHQALRNVILKYKKEVNPDPKYWAAFSIFGAPYVDTSTDIALNISLQEPDDIKLHNAITRYLHEKKIGTILEPDKRHLAELLIKRNTANNTFIIKDPQSEEILKVLNSFDDTCNYLFSFAQGKFLKNLQIKNKNIELEFELLPISHDGTYNDLVVLDTKDYLSKNGLFQVVPNNDSVILKVTNKGRQAFYFSIIEINSHGEIAAFMPNDDCSLNDDEKLILPSETKVFENCYFEFAPPYETLTLKGFATYKPINFRGKNYDTSMKSLSFEEYSKKINSNNTLKKSNKQNTNELKEIATEGYTYEFEYQIVKEKESIKD